MKFLTFDWFERASAAILMVGMAVVIVLTIIHFGAGLVTFITGYSVDIDYAAFQQLFDRVLASVIALELARSVYLIVLGKHGVEQVRVVVLIGVLAVVRKLILLEIEQATALYLLGLSAAILSLGAVYALLYWAEVRVRGQSSPLQRAET